MSGKRLAAPAAALLAVLALSGCGEETTYPGDWVLEVDAICTDGTERAGELAPAASADQVIPDAKARIAILKDVHDRIEAIPLPEGVGEEGVAAYLAELDEDVEVLRTVISRFKLNEKYILLDVSAGVSATSIGLAGCVAFSETIVRMLPPGEKA